MSEHEGAQGADRPASVEVTGSEADPAAPGEFESTARPARKRHRRPTTTEAPEPQAAPVPVMAVEAPVHAGPTSSAGAVVERMEVRQGSIARAEVDDLQVEQGAIGLVRAELASVRLGAVGAVVAERADVRQSIVRTMVARDRVTLQRAIARTILAREVEVGQGSFAGVVLARTVTGEGRILFDWRSGLAFGAALGVAWLLLRGRR